jgi:hypothetical protein
MRDQCSAQSFYDGIALVNMSVAISRPTAGRENTIYDALLPQVMAGTPKIEMDDLLVSVPPACLAFKGGERVYVVPGSKELFLFPSLLYTKISAAANIGGRSKDTVKNILKSVETITEGLRKHLKASRILLDTSPFFGGATHLGWAAPMRLSCRCASICIRWRPLS